MIRSFGSKDTERLFRRQRVARFQAFERSAQRRLAFLNHIRSLDDLQSFLGRSLEAETDDRAICIVGSMTARTRDLSAILAPYRDRSSNYGKPTVPLSNHLPMAVTALAAMGADDDRLATWAAEYDSRQALRPAGLEEGAGRERWRARIQRDGARKALAVQPMRSNVMIASTSRALSNRGSENLSNYRSCEHQSAFPPLRPFTCSRMRHWTVPVPNSG